MHTPAARCRSTSSCLLMEADASAKTKRPNGHHIPRLPSIDCSRPSWMTPLPPPRNSHTKTTRDLQFMTPRR
jgi:hypothetical protein